MPGPLHDGIHCRHSATACLVGRDIGHLSLFSSFSAAARQSRGSFPLLPPAWHPLMSLSTTGHHLCQVQIGLNDVELQVKRVLSSFYQWPGLWAQSCVINKGNGERLHCSQGCHEHREGAWSLFEEYAPPNRAVGANQYLLTVSTQDHSGSDKQEER